MRSRSIIPAALLVLVLGTLGIPATGTDEEPSAAASFGPAGSMAEARRDHTATLLLDGRVLIVGGLGGEADGPLASVELWDPATGSFSPAGSLTDSRAAHTATLLPDGRVLVIGGHRGGEAGGSLASVEPWDPATGSFSPAGSLAEARYLHTATLLPDGHVLIVGGSGGGADSAGLDVAELYDPRTGTSTPTGSTRGPFAHTATLLADGRVLIAGGLFEDLTAPHRAQLYDPVTGTFAPTGSLGWRTYHSATD